MSTPTRLATLQRLHDLKRYQWVCARPLCDGMPHPGMPHRHARQAQRFPTDVKGWALIAGRGFGKTRTGAEWAKSRMLADPKHRLAIIAPDFGAGRDICVEGESGLLSILPEDRIGHWNRSMGELVLANGAQAKIFGTNTVSDADSLRGPQHHSIWAEEISSWRHQQYAWDMALMGLRLGTPMWCATTTPKPQALIKEFLADPDVVKSSGSTFDNADNLAETFLAEMRRKYEGTRLGQQELYAAFIEDIDGALWTREAIEADRITPDDCPAMERIVVAIDPAATSNDQSDETGLAVVGQKGEHFYVLADLSGVFTPGEWSAKAVEAFHAYGADRIIGEANNGGDMIEHAIRQAPGGRNVAYRKVTATRGKALRAEPVQALYEQHRVHHLPYGDLKHLEDQMCTWVPGDKTSPDRLDALVWGLTDLAFGKRRATLSYGGAR